MTLYIFFLFKKKKKDLSKRIYMQLQLRFVGTHISFALLIFHLYPFKSYKILDIFCKTYLHSNKSVSGQLNMDA